MSIVDPVAAKSGFLKMYMSNHPDTLIAYAKFYGHVEGIIAEAEMAAIDTTSMTLSYSRRRGGGKSQVRIPIEPPLANYDAVKPRLLEMKALAQEGLGMIKVPHIKTFYFPRQALQSLFLVFIPYLVLYPRDSTSLFFIPAKYASSYVSDGVLGFIWKTVLGLHTLEGLYTVSLCWRHSTGFLLGLAYFVSTVLFGYPIWQSLRERIQAARIDSVMKVD